MESLLIAKLDELIAVAKRASIPFDDLWLDVHGVAAMLSFKPRYVSERLANRDDFPVPMRVDGSGDKRWRAADVREWALSHQKEFCLP